MTSFWSGWIIILTSITIIGTTWLLFANRKRDGKPGEQVTTGHSYDGIEEYDNPLPGWWFQMFVLTIVFAVIYLIAYPGMGNFKGILGWTSTGVWEQEVADAEAKYAKIYQQYAATPIEELSKNSDAKQIGQRLFANNCAVCHGSDAGGAKGFPNLRDNDWLYGGNPDQIKMSITNGRKAVMPAWAKALDEQARSDVADFLLARAAGQAVDSHPGEQKFQMFCTACHGKDGKGNPMMGAPNLTDNIWLYGGSKADIVQSITNGRNGIMPAHKEMLSEEKIHLLAAYVYGLSQN